MLVVVAVLPSSAGAKPIPYCHLLSTSAVGRAVDYRGVRVEGRVGAALALAGSPGSMASCAFWSGRDHVADSTVSSYETAAKAASEFRAQIRIQSDAHPRPVSGPWRRAYTMSPNHSIGVLKGTHIFYLQYLVKGNSKALVDLAKRAARKL